MSDDTIKFSDSTFEEFSPVVFPGVTIPTTPNTLSDTDITNILESFIGQNITQNLLDEVNLRIRAVTDNPLFQPQQYNVVVTPPVSAGFINVTLTVDSQGVHIDNLIDEEAIKQKEEQVKNEEFKDVIEKRHRLLEL